MTDITPSALANAVMGKLYNVLTNGDGTAPASADNFVSWVTPAYPMNPQDFDFLVQGLTGIVPANSQNLTPELLNQLRAQNTAQVYMQAESLARLVDFIPEVTQLNNNQFAQFNVANNEGTLSDRYKMILMMSQVMDQELDAATQAKIAQFRALLQTTTTQTDLVTGAQTQVTGPSPMVQAYNTKMMAYISAALAYNTARISALTGDDPAAVQNWAINASILRNQVTAAMDDWVANGYKADYEEIAAYIGQVEQRDMHLLKQQYEDDLAKATLTGLSSGSDFYYTSLVPGDFANSNGWSGFSFSIGEYGTYANSSFNASGWSVQGGASYMGLIGVAGSASASQSREEFTDAMNLDSFSLSFQICEVPIVRTWFKEVFITSKTWRFDPTNPDVKNAQVSDGSAPPSGLVAAYPTTAIFVRNLTLGIQQDSAAGKFIDQCQQSAQAGGGYVSLGPFNLGGTASHYSSSGYTQSSYTHSWNDQGLVVPGMQLVAFRCHIFPKSPNPDPSITSWA